MTTQVIPTGDDVVYSQTTSLDGVPYLLRFSFNQREQTWWLLLSTGDGDPIYGSVKLVVSFPLFASCADSRKPPGKLIVVSSTTDLSPPGLEDLVAGGRCQLCYTPAADLATIGQNEAALSGTCDVENASTAIVFSQAQTLQAGTVLVFSEQPGTPYVLETSITNATFGTLTTPYSGASGNGAVAEVLSSGTLLAPLLSQAVGSGAAPEALDGLQMLMPGTSTATSGASGPLTYHSPLTRTALPFFGPSTYPGCVLWLMDNAGIVASGSAVNTWKDQSGNLFDVSQLTTSQRPTYNAIGGPNGTACLTFAGGSSQVLTGASCPVGTTSQARWNWTVFTVAQVNPLAANNGIYGFGSSIDLQINAFGNRVLRVIGVSDVVGGSGTANWEQWTAIGSGNSGVQFQTLRVNGSQVGTEGPNLPGAFASDQWVGAGRSSTTDYLTGSISAIIAFSRPLSATETAGVEAALQNRFGTGSAVLGVTIGGDPAYTYSVTLRFRGVVEQKTYTGASAGCCNEPAVGTNAAFFVTGGTAAGDNFAVYSLTVSNPNFTYYLNAGVSGAGVGGVPTVFEIDYEVTIPVNGGATVTLSGNSIDSLEVANQTDGLGGVPISIPGVSVSQPYVGQFVQMNVVNVR